jgi:hypothetical protein
MTQQTPQQLPVAVLAIDPASSAVDTLAKTTHSFLSFQVLPSGAVYYLVQPQTSGGNQLWRVAPNEPATLVPTPLPIVSDFIVSPDETRLFARTGRGAGEVSYTITNLATGQVANAVDISFPAAISPDVAEIVDRFPSLRVVRAATGASRSIPTPNLPGGATFLEAAWSGGSLKALFMAREVLASNSSRRSIYEWDEGTGVSKLLGYFDTADFGFSQCVAWSPATHSAVMLADSLNDFGFETFSAHYKIVAMKGGVSTTIGSVNATDESLYKCALSADGKLFSFRKSTAVFVKQVP